MSSFIKTYTGAETAPVTMAEALRHLRALEDEADMVWTYVQAATAAVEDYCGRSLVSKTFNLYLPKWPDVGRLIELRRSPLVSISHLKYYADGDTVQTTWVSSNYRALTGRLPGALEILPDAELPALETREDAIEVQFVAGYGTKVSAIPAELRVAVLMLAHYWYDERKPIGSNTLSELPLSVRHLMRAFRVDSQLAIP